MWLVERQRSGGVQRASQPGSSDQSAGSILPPTRHQAALASWSLARARSSLRLSRPARPLASTTQRAASVVVSPPCSKVTWCGPSPSSSATSRTIAPSRKSTPSARALAEEVLEAAAVDLPRRRRQQPAHAQLGAAVDVHAAFG